MALTAPLLHALRCEAERRSTSLPELVATVLEEATPPKDAVGQMLDFARAHGFVLDEDVRIRDLWPRPGAR